jgi:predicted  nucleic acid-binding Zn-ribbon protein
MADSALGSALVIPESALKKIKEADDKLQKLQDTAKNTASSVTQSFKDMSVGTKPFLNSLDQVIAKLATINASASNASSGISNVGASAGNMNNNITSAAQNIQNMVAQLSKMNGSGTSGIMQAALAFQRLQESAKGASGMNIAELKQEIGSIESMLRDTTQNLTKADQDALIKRKKSLQDELRYQQQMYNERAVAFQKALDKMVSAEQSYNNKQRKAYADRAKDYQTRNNKANTTYQGALDFSASANTLNRQVRAIEYLKEARMKLSQTDADYKRKLDILNAAIEQHNKNLKEAGVNSRALTEQTSYMAGYMSRWAQRMAFAFSVGSVKNFVEQIASVRGQFELSERSLEAILQNKPKADEIFNKTVELAVKSPFRIKDLVDYTRQLSAYRIESDKLYDTTKRLADVSAGLGVDMGRLILAYGQVKAAAYLRGSEVRQFTEAGINMYGELQQYFKEVKGEAYTTAQIVDMISKRKVTFEDVEAIFQRMTDKGGTFYNMQEIQAETLQGKISNLKDAFDVMLNDIGTANDDVFKGLISGATVLLRHWETIASVGKDLIGILALLMLQSNKTGVSLKEIWNANFTSYSLKGKNALGLITASFRNLGSAAKTAGKMIKWAVMDNLPLIAFAALAQAVSSAYFAYEKFREEQSKIITETIDAKKRLGELSAEYERIKDKFTERADGGVRIIINKDRFLNDSKSVLEDLYDELKKRNLEIPISIEKVDLSNLDKAIKESKKKIDTFIQMAQDAKSYINGEDNSFFNSNNLNLFGIPLWADSFSKDMKELDDAANDVRQFASRAQTAIEALGEGYDKLSVKSRAAYDSIKDGAKPNELDVEYLQRVNKVMGEIFDNERNNSSFEKYANNLRKQLYGLSDNLGATLSGSFRSAKEEAANEIQGLFDSINNIYGGFLKNLKPAEIKVFWDNVATENNLGELQKKILLTIASKVYHFKVDADSQSMNNARQRVYSFMDDLQAEADRRKIKISLDVIDPKDALNSVQGFQRSAKDIKELIDQINRGKIQWYHGSSLGISNTMKWGSQNVGVNTVFNKKNAIAFLRSQLKNVLTKNNLAGGLDPFANQNTRNKSKVDKQQRDILNERISLLKDMNSEYQKLIKYEGEEQATADVRKHFALAAKNVGMNINNFIPDRQTIAKKIEYLASQYKELGKRGSALRNATEIRLDIDEEYFKQQLDDAKNNAQEAFSQLDLFKKLKGEGLSDSIIKSMFGDLTSSFDDVRKSITDDFEAKWSKDQTKWGDDVAKEYTSQMQKLDKEVYQDQINQAQELIKAYKQQLSDQLQLDKWYIEEKQKIQNNANISKNKDLQKQLQDNLDKQYASKTDTNSWKDFQNSDMYISIFENLDHTSNRVLTAMKARLEGLRSSLKNLTPEQLKQIVEQINKIDALLVERNPYSNIGKNFKEYLKFAKQRKKLEEEYIDATQKEQILKNDQSNANKDVKNAEIAYNNAVRKYGIASKEAIQSRILWDIDKAKLRTITDQLVAQGKITEKQAEQIRNGQKLQKTLQQQVQTIGQNFSDAASSVTELFSALNDWGANIEMSDDLSEVVDGISKIGSSLEGIDITRPFSVVKGTIGVIGGIGKTLGGIFGWGTKDKKLQKQIENHQKAIEKLRERYSELKDAMDNAFDIERLAQYNDEMVKNLKTQNANLESMIKAEQDKKKTDNDKIEEYRKQIEANNKAIEEAEQSLTEQLGGFGTKANYKSAAEEFAKTWVDAYNEGSDALEALNDKFDEYIQNLIVKQATQRIVGKMVEPLFKKIDNAVEQGSDGGNNGLNLVKAELDNIMTTGKDKLKGVSDMLKSFVDGLGYKPKGSSNISALQQGIQSVTESTAQALESILNSLRYYVATQQADVRIIRDTLLEKLGNSISAITQDTSSSPVLIELRLQTTILTDIRDTLASCVKGGHKQGRNGIKVFMN